MKCLYIGLPLEFVSIKAFEVNGSEVYGFDEKGKTVLWDGFTVQLLETEFNHLLSISGVATVAKWTRQETCSGSLNIGDHTG